MGTGNAGKSGTLPTVRSVEMIGDGGPGAEAEAEVLNGAHAPVPKAYCADAEKVSKTN